MKYRSKRNLRALDKSLSQQSEAKALVLVKEMRAIDNAALLAVTDLDTLAG